MNSIHRTLRRFALAALTATAFLSQAQAAPVVSISPATQNVAVGSSASVAIVVSGLTDPTGGFSLTLGFNPSFLSGVSWVNDPLLKFGPAPLDLSLGFSGGSLDLFFVADASLTGPALSALQGPSFTLATVSFTGLSDGLSPVTISELRLSAADGITTLAGVTSTNGEICVGRCDISTPIPEPETYLLFAAGLSALAIRRRRAR